jgi:hydroxymethylglutaryl-CoA reductase
MRTQSLEVTLLRQLPRKARLRAVKGRAAAVEEAIQAGKLRAAVGEAIQAGKLRAAAGQGLLRSREELA